MKRLFSILLALASIFLITGTALATNGYQLVGVGQYQNSMGGAVTAAPMDAMTAITNPAGIARIGKRADFSMEGFFPTRNVDFSKMGTGFGSTGDKEEGGSKMYGIPALGWAAPAFGKDNVFFGGGMFGTSGLGVDYGQVTMVAGPAAGQDDDITFDGYSAIQFWKMAPTVAWNFNDKLSLGAALNVDYQSVTIRQRFRNIPVVPAYQAMWGTTLDINFDLGRPTTQFGYGATIGGLYDITDMVTIGASYSTKQVFSEGEFRVGNGDIYGFNGAQGLPGTYKLDLEYPQQGAIGVSIKPIEPLLIAADIKWINWSGTHDKVKLSGPDGAFMTASGPANSTELEFGWEDQWVYAIGAQYKAMKNLSVRAGYNYAKSPIDEADVFNNLVFPAIVEHHVSVGADYMLGEHWGIGFAYMKAFENTLEGKNDVPEGMQALTGFPASSAAKTSLEEDSVGMQLTYKF